LASFNIVLTIGRFRIHWKKSRRFRWDDYFNALAVLLLLGYIITMQILLPRVTKATDYASGHRATVKEVIFINKLGLANFIFQFGTIYAVKASFLALYWQIFEISNPFRICWALSTAFIAASFLATVLAYLWSCGSPQVLFKPRKAHLYSWLILTYSLSKCNVVYQTGLGGTNYGCTVSRTWWETCSVSLP